MSGEWFSNRAQIVQTVGTVFGVFFGGISLYFLLRSNHALPPLQLVTRVAGIILVVGIVFWLGRKSVSSRRTASLEQAPTVLHPTAEVLKTLPVYLHDLKLELLAFCRGTTLNTENATFFLKLSVVSQNDGGVWDMNLTCYIDSRTCQTKPMDDLSGWILRTPFKNPRYPYKTFDEQSLDSVSLWKELRQGGLKAGIEKVGWIGLHVPEFIPLQQSVFKVRVEIVKAGQREPYKFTFLELMEKDKDEHIFDRAFREPE